MMETLADRYYKPSGAVPLFGTILMQLFGAAAALLLGGLYAAANYYSPSVWLTGLAVLVFGAGVGFAVHLGAKIGKVRNPGFILLLGSATGLFAIYFAWVFYIFLFWKQQLGLPIWVWNPVQIYHNMALFAEEGIWAMESWTPKGWVLYAFWAAEALCVVLLAVAVSVANDTPYCDYCNAWTKKEKDVASFALADPLQLKGELEEERYEVLDTLHAQPADPGDCLKALIHACPQCEDSDYLTINHAQIVTDSDGNETTKETEVVKHLRIPRDLSEHLRDLGHAPPVLEEPQPAPEDEVTL
jgi:hypothetical protein